MTIEKIHESFLKCSGASTDTRSIKKNEMFFCLKGPNFNANQFAAQALKDGALFVVIDDQKYFDETNSQYILVDDVLDTLQELAKYHRTFTNTKLIALTGSNGKTTTKELIHMVLSKKYETIATIGNLNNHIGVPLTLLRLQPSTEIGIIEMGANHQKEIEALCEITTPDYGYITNFGKAHLEGFGGIEGVIKGKSELYQHLEANKKTAFVRVDDEIQLQKTKKIDTISFSTDPNIQGDYNFSSGAIGEYTSIVYKNHNVHTHLSGIYNLSNLAAAMTIGLHFEIEIQQIIDAIENYIPTNNRSQWMNLHSNEILMDAYNANPSSMKVSIENFSGLDKPNKVMILGDMFELGEFSDREHKNIIDQVENSKIRCYFIGKSFFKNKIENDTISFFETYEDFIIQFDIKNIQNQTLLVKGSRGMALERILA